MKKIFLIIALIVCAPEANAQWSWWNPFSWFITLKGSRGDKGPQGYRGYSGDQGPSGERGEEGDGWEKGYYDSESGRIYFINNDGTTYSTDDLRILSLQGVRGTQGDKGDTGVRGPQGPPGAEALPIARGEFYKPPWKLEIVGNETLGIATSKRVGIRTADFSCEDCSEYSLFINGGLRTEKVKVSFLNENSWADKVFKKGYELMSLDSLEAFIKKNHHLPEVPTAREVVKDGGIELKQMNVLLLKKVEELTLHTIELSKRSKHVK